MEIQVGIDIIEIERFKNAYRKYKQRFLKKIFSAEEIKFIKGDIIKMCISFSLKESIWKSLPENIQKNYTFNKLKIGWKKDTPFLLNKIKNYKLLISYSATEKYVITLVLLFRT